MSDWFTAVHSTVPSATAGLDLEMPTGGLFGEPLQKAVANGSSTNGSPQPDGPRHPDAHVSPRVSSTSAPAQGPKLQTLNVSTPADIQTALTLAEDGTVLLKNAGNVLPLAKTGKSIAVIGRSASSAGAEGTYGGGASSHVPAFGLAHVVAPLSAIRQMAAKHDESVVYNDGSDTASAVAAAEKSASVAVVFADDAEGETQDKPNLTLRAGTCTFVCAYSNENQDALIASVARANPHTIVVLDSGGPVLMPWISQVKGIVEAWYPGQQDGNAIAAVLFGSVDPSWEVARDISRLAKPASNGHRCTISGGGQSRVVFRGPVDRIPMVRRQAHCAALSVWLRALLYEVFIGSVLGPKEVGWCAAQLYGA